MDSLQKTAVRGTSHIIPEVLQAETGLLFLEEKPFEKGQNNDDDNDNYNNSVLIY
jgi:hypothetical protein